MSPKTELKCLLVRFKGQTTVFEQQALDINKLSRIKFIFWLFAFKTAKTDSSKQQQKHIKIHINSLLQHFSSVHLKYSEHSNMNKTALLLRVCVYFGRKTAVQSRSGRWRTLLCCRSVSKTFHGYFSIFSMKLGFQSFKR